MLRNYFNTAVRTLVRHRFFSSINIFGLALAMSVCMAIIMLVADQLQYDRHNSKKNLIHRVMSMRAGEDGKPRPDAIITATSPMVLKHELEKYSGIENTVRFKRGFGNGWIEFENQDVNIPLSGYFADPGVLDMFEHELQFGDAATALNAPFSVVLTRKAADKLFSEENPVGKTLKVGDQGLYTVTGVIKEKDHKSHIVFEGLASMSSLESINTQKGIKTEYDWNDYWSQWTYIQVKPATDLNDIQIYLDKIYDDKIGSITTPDANKMRFQLQSLTEMTPGPFVNNPIGPSLPWFLVYIFAGLAAVIMVTSCFNFTNLSIAKSLARAREIGVRKVNGASRFQIFFQFISESIIISFCALIVSLGLLMLLKPMILQLNFARVFKWDLVSNGEVYLVFVVFAIFVGFLAGSFPAIVLSGFQPVKVLKSVTSMKLFSKMGLRKALLVSQFTMSLIFILSVTVLYRQLNLFLNASHGFDLKEQISLKLNKTSPGPLKNELAKHSNIVSVTAVSHLPAAGTTYGASFKQELSDKDWQEMNYYWVDEDYVENLSLTIVAGKDFDQSTASNNENNVLINESAVKAYGFADNMDAIGQHIVSKEDSSKRTIVGVLKDYNHQAMLQKIEPLALMYRPSEFSILQIKYSGTYTDAMKTVNESWAVVNPGLKVQANEMESEVMILYNTLFGDAFKILGFIAFLAIAISCLGLLGMATYATESRIREVSVRKVLGSSNGALVYLLSKGFIVILLISLAIGIPAAYFLNTMWLELLAYHVSMDPPTMLFGTAMLILFGIITIGSQTYRATFVNPVENLKSE